MNDNQTSECQRIRPLLFEVVDEAAGREERAAVAAHLAACEDCRRELREERALSELLRRPRAEGARQKRQAPLRLLGKAAAVLLFAALALFGLDALSETPAYGSISAATLSLSMTVESARPEPLDAHNHFAIPLDSVYTLDLAGVAVLRIAGPAVVDLDHGEEGWKATLLRGRIRAEVAEGARLLVSTLLGQRELAAGSHLVALDAGSAEASELLHAGLDLFFEHQEMAEAERIFRLALEAPDLDAELRSQVLFYLAAALGRQDALEQAIEVQDEWLRLDAEPDARAYVLYFHGLYHEALGNPDEARECWRAIRAEDPESELLEGIELEERAPAAPPRSADRPSVSYVVVEMGLAGEDPAHRRFAEIAGEVAAWHRAERIEASPDRLDALEARLGELAPENALIVLPPELLDVNLHRRILLLSARLDGDALPDLCFGYFTSRDAEGLRALWERTKRLHEGGLPGSRWINAFVTSGMRSTIWASYLGDHEEAAGFSGPGIGFACVEDDPDCLAWAREKLGMLEEAAVIQLTGNGDPQGIWLFAGARNLDHSKHWAYDPKLVGCDPKGELARITAADIRALSLDGPIVWSGTCHSAATQRVFVEGDIVSTFGVTDRVTVHELPPEESLGLAILDAGATAFLAPIAANHGFSVDLESGFALREGASLGEAIKSTWDDVFLAAGGELHLDLPRPGAPHESAEAVMQGGGANRILIGDPSLRPFRAVADPRESRALVPREEGGFDVVLEWDEGFHARGWDIYGTDPDDWRIGERVEVTEVLPEGAAIEASVEVTAADGSPLPFRLTRAEQEVFHGRRFLHLQANANREAGKDRAKTARFRVRVSGAKEPR